MSGACTLAPLARTRPPSSVWLMKLGIVNVRREMHLLLQAPFFGLIPAREELAINVAKAHMTTTLLVEVFCPVCTQLEISVPYPIGHEQFESWVKMGKAHDETTILQIPNSFSFLFLFFRSGDRGRRTWRRSHQNELPLQQKSG